MTRFATVLETSWSRRGLTNVRWMTVAERAEHPGGRVTLEQYNALYRALDANSSPAVSATTSS